MNRAMKLYITIAALTCTLINAQQIDVQVVYNNTADIKTNTETINKIKSAVKTTELQTALNSNGHITDKNLVIRVAFFDRGVIGQLKLKAEHELTPKKYIEEWQKTVSKKSGILFLFVKGNDSTQYSLNKMVASQQLENEHLFPLVTEFINENLSGDFSTVVGNGTKYLANAITPVWTETKESSAENLITNNSKYWSNRINLFHGWFGFYYFDLRPSDENETKNMKLVNCMTRKTGGNWFVSDKYMYTSSDELGNLSSKKSYEWNISFDEDVNGVTIIYDAFLHKILDYTEGTNKHNANESATNWPWQKAVGDLSISDLSGFTDRTADDKLILFYNDDYKNREGEELSILHPSYKKITWCNVYSCDLANEVLFGNIFGDIHNGPWGSHGSAGQMHEKINASTDFKTIGYDDAWKYTNAGYVVYLTAYNYRYYKGYTTKPLAYSGHIATCYPTESYEEGNLYSGRVVQAGGNHGILNFGTQVWTDSRYGKNKEDIITANLYLGYILK